MKYTGEYKKEISFPLGGIGTGSIGINGEGRLVDWEIFNRPAKGSICGYTHFAVRAIENGKITAAVLNGDIENGLQGQYEFAQYRGFGFGPNSKTMCGFPHFKDIEFDGEFPIATLKFRDEEFPANIKMTAFNPFIPLDADNSSIPAAFFELEAENTTETEIKYQFAFSVCNNHKVTYNKSEVKDGYNTIMMYNADAAADDVEYADLTVATDCDKSYAQTYWYRGSWMDNVVSFWNEFSSEISLKERVYDTNGAYDMCTLMAEIDVKPGEKKSVRFVLSWNAPNNYRYWDENTPEIPQEFFKPWKNYYATVFENSSHSAVYSLSNWDSLYKRTLKFKNALHGISLPQYVIDAATSNLSVLKSPTVLRLEDGSFYGWEGVHQNSGSCEGTCQHVWNYAYAMCFLFPSLERSVRDLEFKYSTSPDGKMMFRLHLPLDTKSIYDFRACVDGQMGAVIKCYREWKISGNDEWLRGHWDSIKKVLEYAWSEENPDKWDYNKDGVLEGRQHHTLDMELFGPSSWLEGMYLAALKAAAEMAEYLGEADKALEYRKLFENGYAWSKNNLFNGKYFIQKVDLTDKSLTDKFDASEKYWNSEANQIKYQVGEGSSIDQLLGQWHADILGLGDIFDKEQINASLDEMIKNNFKSSMRGVVNAWRIFSINDEAGSVICDYPEYVERPAIPIPYSDETMTGFEYSFAGLLCSQGKTDDGLRVAKAVRDRFDGKKRNPWNEFECGSNYARSMASYALIPILSGFEFNMPYKHIGFNPYLTDNFSTIWSLEDAWGTFEISGGVAKLNIEEGEISLKSLGLKFCDKVSSVKIDGKATDFKFEKGNLYFGVTNISSGMEIVL